MSQTDFGETQAVFTPKPDLPPPAITVGIIGWVRGNLLPDWFNGAMTVLALIGLYFVIPPVVNWALLDAHFVGDSRKACKPNVQIVRDQVVTQATMPDGSTMEVTTSADRIVVPEGVVPNVRWERRMVEGVVRGKGREYAKVVVEKDVVIEGACWVFVGVRFDQFIYGFYPKSERWRPTVVIGIGLLMIIYMLTDGLPHRGRVAMFLLIPFPVIAFFMFSGGVMGMPHVDNSKWGGLVLTIIISSVAITGALPLGVALALGRRSQMPIIRWFCIIVIEFFRSVPMITILFMALVVLPLFLPPGTSFDQLLRVLIGVTIFIAAYTAEVVRGGLAALPTGQYEAANALGLGYWKMMRLIILPQALRIMIPAIVSLFIGIFKDTTLVQIVGLNDLLTMVQLAVTDAQWIGLSKEGYFFCGFVFFIFCFSMSRYSMYLERKLHTGH
ncbi:MAG: amino acid ABC transporter permease [Rhodospirillaceae bacterium]|jgi:general L-amino acid transport system permease protein|nr:amino acid ABC transporter permease [Rhodospirillaceae bacterium]MBT3493929.1 amino acid ABC transporter permease [Rhodospirillaceae bacterium]MBT3780798.1 amino acid ABC transporter permease [Rhodospirillaceae bacterium]MBT3976225.1 amino acid ABC transporter permease [Rhodospirillaceae bacterium]MBT4563367.1 amino acid ABC transporter permease [Rhodospirillaceae bacterium]